MTTTLAEPSHHPAQDLRTVLEHPNLPYLAIPAALGDRDANGRLVHVHSGTTLDIVHAEGGPPITQRTLGLREAAQTSQPKV